MANPLAPILWVPGKLDNVAEDIAMLGKTGPGFRRLMNLIPGMSDEAMTVASRVDSPYVNPFSQTGAFDEAASQARWLRNQEDVMRATAKTGRMNEVDYAANEAADLMSRYQPALSQAAADAAQAEILSDYLLSTNPMLYSDLTNSMNTGRMVDRLSRRLPSNEANRFQAILRSLGMMNKIVSPSDIKAARALAAGGQDLEGLTMANLEFSMNPESLRELTLAEAYRRAANPERYL